MIAVHKVDTTNPRDVRRFVRFPFRLYRGCSQWVPPLLSAAREQLDRERFPFYRHSDADFFLALQGGEVVGRIAVMEHRRRNAHWGKQGALFYLFETVDDREVSDALFDAAFSWARARGLEEILGPEGFMTGDGFGVLVDGFEFIPAMGIPYNYPYYDALVRAAGFEKWHDFYSCRLSADFELPDRFRRVAEKVKQRRGYRILRFESKDDLRRVAPRVIAAYNAAFADNPRFVPITGVDTQKIIERLIGLTRPDLVKVVAKDDAIVGFILGLPNVSRALQRCRGRLFPFGWALLLWEARHTPWVDLNGGGILPQYQGLGSDAILAYEMYTLIQEQGFEEADLVQIRDDNTKMVKELEAVGATINKLHRQYVRPL
jgi:ribosomal protein S18 acetylase RimI-like enzyme